MADGAACSSSSRGFSSLWLSTPTCPQWTQSFYRISTVSPRALCRINEATRENNTASCKKSLTGFCHCDFYCSPFFLWGQVLAKLTPAVNWGADTKPRETITSSSNRIAITCASPPPMVLSLHNRYSLTPTWVHFLFSRHQPLLSNTRYWGEHRISCRKTRLWQGDESQRNPLINLS